MDDIDIPETGSLLSTSKGVFVLQADSSNENNNIGKSDGFRPIRRYEPIVDLETPTFHLRRALYRTAWSECQRHLDGGISSLYDATLQDLDDFVLRAPATCLQHKPLWRSFCPVPTAVIQGSNDRFNAAILSRLSKLPCRLAEDSPEKNERYACIGVRVGARDCSTFAAACKKIIAGLMTATGDSTHQTLSLGAEDLQNLVLWYAAEFEDDEEGPKLVIILEEFEALSPNVAENLIIILSRYSTTLPFIFIVCVTSSIKGIVSVLPRTCLVHMDLSFFDVHFGTDALAQLFKTVFVDSTTVLDLGPNVFSYLLQSFEDTDQSLEAFIAKIHYIHMAFFYRNPLSILSSNATFAICDNEAITALASALRSTNSWEGALQNIRQTVSTGEVDALAAYLGDFEIAHTTVSPPLPQLHPHNTSAKILEAALYDDTVALHLVQHLYKSRPFSEKLRSTALVVLGVLVETWPEKRQSPRAILEGLWSGEILMRARELAGLVRKTDDARLLLFLERVERAFSDEEHNETRMLPDTIKALQTYATELRDLVKHGERGSGRRNLVNSNMPNPISGLTTADERFTCLATRSSEALQTLFSEAFPARHKMLFHEVWTFDDVDLMKEAFTPNPAYDYANSFVSPTTYLGRFDPAFPLEDQDGDAQVLSPDTCEAYRLYLDSGKLVNLYDWFNAFDSICDDRYQREASAIPNTEASGPQNEKINPRRSASTGLPRQNNLASSDASGEVTQNDLPPSAATTVSTMDARFVRAVADLGFLGYVVGTKRRPDHVARVVW